MVDSTPGFRHEALLYRGEEAFVDVVLPYLETGLENGEPVLVVTSSTRTESLRRALGSRARAVDFEDMCRVGANPARILPLWRRFLDEHKGRLSGIRGVGEPITPTRSPAELVECQIHEALLNVAFAGDPGFLLACPYDTTALSPDVIAEAGRSHPHLTRDGATAASPDYAPGVSAFRTPLPSPPAGAATMSFGAGDHRAVRRWLSRRLSEQGMATTRGDEMVLAAHEVVVNSVMHGAGNGLVRLWREEDTMICDVEDLGWVADAMIGRREPPVTATNGRGLWLANHLCDLVQIRSQRSGTVVRLHKSLA